MTLPSVVRDWLILAPSWMRRGMGGGGRGESCVREVQREIENGERDD